MVAGSAGGQPPSVFFPGPFRARSRLRIPTRLTSARFRPSGAQPLAIAYELPGDGSHAGVDRVREAGQHRVEHYMNPTRSAADLCRSSSPTTREGPACERVRRDRGHDP